MIAAAGTSRGILQGALRTPQQIARALLVHGISGEIVPTDAGGLLLIVDDVSQLEAARDAVAAYFPEVTRVTTHAQ